ncbi:helix-turn-helix protein [Murinocardiopsis flavida]|uniref:Helix-turn-helix protein n=1 Tax=Murinocardiopsis flavida TaxID=645275 RepID=A0A2P8CMN6_9ACTN|nr:helix-turn-helix transcriptional regulator [Murinocardiopsis flavida]PSK86236.1 helix-turn-helix protein [Murinocardiopsis flavida]
MTTPTVNRWQLARTLKNLRGNTPPADVAKALKTTVSTVHRWETSGEGGSVPSPGALDRLLDLYRVPPSEAERITALRRNARKNAWWNPYRVERTYGMFVDLESAATSIETYESTLIAGLAQTQDYARAVIRATNIDGDDADVDQEVTVRLARQQAWSESDGARLGIVLGEAAVRQCVGGSAVMRKQLEHLAEFSHHPKVELQVLPYSAGEHAAIHAAGFATLKLTNDGLAVVYSASQTGSLFLDDPPVVERYTTIFNKLRIAASGEGASRDLISSIMRDL